MRELTKSIMSASIAGALFGARQLTNVATQPPRNGEPDAASEAFNTIAQAAADQSKMADTFHAVDRIQRQFVDTGFRFLSFDALRSTTATESASAFAEQASNQFRQWVGGCGCGNQDCDGSCEHPTHEPENPWHTDGIHPADSRQTQER